MNFKRHRIHGASLSWMSYQMATKGKPLTAKTILAATLALMLGLVTFAATADAQQTRRTDIFGGRTMTGDNQPEQEIDPYDYDSAPDDNPYSDLQATADGPYTDGPYENGPYESGRPIEDLNLRSTPRDRANPYDPLGLRAGSFLIFPEIALRGGYTDNVLRSPGPKTSGPFIETEGSVEARSNWSRHELSGSLRGLYTSFKNSLADDETIFQGELSSRIDILRSTTATFSGAFEYQQESGNRDFEYSGDAGLSHRFNRVTGTLRGSVDLFEYSDRTTTTGSAAQDDVADYKAYEVAARVAYEFSPAVSVYVEGATNRRVFNNAIDLNGFLRGSQGYSASAGTVFDLGALLRGTVAVGYQLQKPDDPTFEDFGGLLVDVDVTWAVTPLTTVTLVTNTEINETTTLGSSGSIRNAVGIGLRHELRDNLILVADAGYARNNFEGTGPTEQEFTGAFGIEYLLNRNIALTANYTYYAFETTNTGADYTVNSVLVGLKLRK